jgi:hypothetical protein
MMAENQTETREDGLPRFAVQRVVRARAEEMSMLDFSKHKRGDVVEVHCCDRCAIQQGVRPKAPADSGVQSWLCEVCGHHGIGSRMECRIGAWLSLEVLAPDAAAAP